MSFNLDGTLYDNADSIPNFRCDTISSLSSNVINCNSRFYINDQLNVYGPVYITGNTNIGQNLFFSNTAGNTIGMSGNGTINDLNTISPSSNNPLKINNNFSTTQVQLQNCISPGLLISNINSTNWIGLQAGNYTDNTSVVLGVLNGNAIIGSHNANRTAWTDLYINTGANTNIGSASNTEQLTVLNNIRTDNGSFYKNSVDMFKYQRFSNFGGSEINISNTTYAKIFEFVYLGSNFSGEIENIFLSLNPNGNTLSIRITDDINAVVICEQSFIDSNGVNGIFSFGTISNLTYFAKAYSIYAKIDTGLSIFKSGCVYFKWTNP
jgi:hypothetical protein